MTMKWKSEYNTGIDIIDEQHRRILDYINELDEVLSIGSYQREQIEKVLNQIIDYTQSHFTFEESLQEEAGYKYRVPHKRVHDLFIRKVEKYRECFMAGDGIEEDLHQLLCNWLINHIRHDDADYVGSVKDNMLGIIQEKEKKKGKNWFARFFG